MASYYLPRSKKIGTLGDNPNAYQGVEKISKPKTKDICKGTGVKECLIHGGFNDKSTGCT